ncbi:MAG: hypothetical protein QOK29_3137 [Rhodospirillaceae bacterium]|jgi:uncharacterized membrane protein (DUF4010 family)|nr:hypothetical protein [Rhodospirillaceae bacterium]
MADQFDPRRLLLLLGLSLFIGLAYEGFYHARVARPPGGIRSFPLLALIGAGLYYVESKQALAFIAGLLILGAWLLAYYHRRIGAPEIEDEPGTDLVAPLCNLVAYLLGPVTLLAPIWVSVGLAVAAVLLLSARERLHMLAHRVPGEEIITLGKFLVLTGIILPLLPNEPVTSWTTITPYEVWLAVVAFSAVSYGSYLTQRYLPLGNSIIFASILGGLYSSTATTVVLARRIPNASGATLQDIKAGIVLATALMYLRIGIMTAVFNLELARQLAPALAVLLLFALALAFLLHGGINPGTTMSIAADEHPGNPLELSAAAIFAISFVLVSLASAWLKSTMGSAGVLWFAGIVGVADVDPFVISVAQGGVAGVSMQVLVVAVLIAASSNNLLKAIYAIGFSGSRNGLPPAAALASLSIAGFGIAAWLW